MKMTRTVGMLLGFVTLAGCGPDNSDPSDTLSPGTVRSYDVVAGVTSDSGLLGAIQINIDHRGSSGGWQGAGGGVNCRFFVGALKQCNDQGAGRIACAIIDTTGFVTPADLVACVFKSNENVSVDDFTITIVDVSSPDLNAARPTVDVEITSVSQR